MYNDLEDEYAGKKHRVTSNDSLANKLASCYRALPACWG